MINQKPALIFDFCGVLVDWNPSHLYRQFFHEDEAGMEDFLTEIKFYAWNLEQDKGRSFAEGVTELTACFPQYIDLIKAYDERWEESLGGLIQTTIDTLQPLKENGYPLYGLTNWSYEKFQLVRQKFPFIDLFNSVIVSGEVRLVKPDPQIYNLMLAEIHLPASECIFIDDSEANIIAARQLGFNTIHFQSAGQMLAELAQMGIIIQL